MTAPDNHAIEKRGEILRKYEELTVAGLERRARDLVAAFPVGDEDVLSVLLEPDLYVLRVLMDAGYDPVAPNKYNFTIVDRCLTHIDYLDGLIEVLAGYETEWPRYASHIFKCLLTRWDDDERYHHRALVHWLRHTTLAEHVDVIVAFDDVIFSNVGLMQKLLNAGLVALIQPGREHPPAYARNAAEKLFCEAQANPEKFNPADNLDRFRGDDKAWMHASCSGTHVKCGAKKRKTEIVQSE